VCGGGIKDTGVCVLVVVVGSRNLSVTEYEYIYSAFMLCVLIRADFLISMPLLRLFCPVNIIGRFVVVVVVVVVSFINHINLSFNIAMFF
jgi:hypothetical protein